MKLPQHIMESISEISRSHVILKDFERELKHEVTLWLEHHSKRIESETDEVALNDIINELTTVVNSLLSISETPYINMLAGKMLTLLLDAGQAIPHSRKIMRHLINRKTADKADTDKKLFLVLKPSIHSTLVACFEGIEKICETEIHVSPDIHDGVNSRIEDILSWLSDKGITLSSFEGIACRSGFFQPVPTGTYRIVPEMLEDLEHPRIDHPSNMSVEITMKLAKLSGRENDILLTTSDPVVSDELELVDRLTGFIKIKRDGSGAQYLNHKAVFRLLSSVVGCKPRNFHAITAHLSNGISLVLHRGNRAISIFDAFSGIPTTNRCGPLDLSRLIEAIKTDEITFKELESVTLSRGGLLSLAGTNDFRTLEGFLNKGATTIQQKKIRLIFDFFARQITSAALKLTSDGKEIDVMALSGGLAHTHELSQRIEENIAGRYPVVYVHGSIGLESLAAGLITGIYEPETLKHYVKERDALREKRREEDRLIDTVIFDRKVIYRKKGAPIVSLDELIDATRITVKENYLPSIAIVGADNEEAILAAKRANEEGNYRIAKFQLLGDFTQINQIAYDFDLIIDNDNYSIYDTEDPVQEAVSRLDSNMAHILMKGSLHTDELLRGVFHYLKNSGKLKRGQLISHVFVMDIPVRNKLLLITDAAVNPYPDVEKSVKIIENALKVATHLNIAKPKVAVISAIENVNRSIESSVEAEHIAERFVNRNDCIVEGPLSFDVAMNRKIALEKQYKGDILGSADILVMPDIDVGNVLYKSLTTQSGATAAGVILCGDMPLILTSRGDSARSKLASISLAVKLFFDLHDKQKKVTTSSERKTHHGLENIKTQANL